MIVMINYDLKENNIVDQISLISKQKGYEYKLFTFEELMNIKIIRNHNNLNLSVC